MQAEDSASNSGCSTVVAIVTALAVFLMVAAGLFLPPFSLYDRLFGVQYVRLEAVQDVAGTADNSLRVSASQPGVGVALDTTSLYSFLSASDAEAGWIAAARAAVPAHLALQSSVYRLQTDASANVTFTYDLALPAAASPDVIDVYGFDEGAGRWVFLPSNRQGERVVAQGPAVDYLALFQAAPLQPVVVIEYEVTQLLTPQVAALADIVAPAGLQPTLAGTLTGSLAPGFAMDAAYAVMPVVRDYADPRAIDTETVAAILGNSSLRAEHARQLASLAAGGFDGVWLDYRGIPAEQRANLSVFVRLLAERFRAANIRLGVIVPPAVFSDGQWDTGAYDWRVIGEAADYVQINVPIAPLGYLGGGDASVEAMLRYAVGHVDRSKIVLGMSVRSVRDIQGTLSLVGYDEGLAGLGNVVVTAEQVTENGIVQPGSTIRARLDGRPAIAGVDTRINTPYVDYLDAQGNPAARIWLTTSDALRYRLGVGTAFALAGAGFDDLLHDDLAQGISAAVEDYRQQLPLLPSPTDLVLQWRIEGTNGLLQEVNTALGAELVTTLNAPDGNYAVNVAVVGTGAETNVSVRSGAAVAMFAPTPTPTPLPTPTPTPIPTATFTPAPIIATAAPVGGGFGGSNFGAVAPGAGSIRLGQFEYGGHVTSAGSTRAMEAMRRAGMTWMKVQMRYTPGANAAEAAGYISAAQSNGFKILIGTVGNPQDLANGGDNYVAQYVNWLATIASMGPNAIEVWNEPNLSREWPEGQISGVAYANMLQRAYSAIKRTNPSVIVISAAPGPTGAENAYPGQVMNDDRWLSEVVAAGGLGYTDCVGIHYNEGIVPPSSSGGDPRDNYYTRYFSGMVDRYWNIIGGQKPLCFTELGYLSPEGFSVPLDPYFAWAQNVTVAQQAAWLAQAAALSSQSGKVKMMIVWNVDFSNFGTDPMGGYAMIRPDGSCPACDALAAAR
jgi:hypothetical protein